MSAAPDFVTANLQALETLTPEFAIRMMLDSMDKVTPTLDGIYHGGHTATFLKDGTVLVARSFGEQDGAQAELYVA